MRIGSLHGVEVEMHFWGVCPQKYLVTRILSHKAEGLVGQGAVRQG